MASNPQWLENLRAHSIFKHGFGSGHLNNDSLIVCHGSETLVAANSIVRYADVSKMSNFIELDLPDVDFEIQSIILNDLRSLLVVVGTRKIVTAILPRGRNALTGSIKTRVVGKSNHSKTTISRVRIHPHCATSTSLVVLTADGYLRMYDIHISNDEADIIVDLQSPGARGTNTPRSFGIVEEIVPVDFCFGHGGDGWSTFSVFVLLLSGDVLVVVPLLPNTCQISDGEHERLDAFLEESAPSLGVERIRHAILHGSRVMAGTNFTRPARMLTPVVSEPILFSPPPVEFSTAEVAAQAIAFYPSQPINILAIAFEGKIDICLVMEPLVPRPDIFMSVAVNETISLPNAPKICFLTGTFQAEERIIFISQQGVQQIDMKAWQSTLTALDDLNTIDDAEALLKEAACSPVDHLLEAKVPLAASVLVHKDLDSFLLGVDTHGALLVRQIDGISTNSEEQDETDDNDELLSAIPTESKISDDVRYQSLIAAPAYRPPNRKPGSRPIIPESMSRKLLTPNIETLQFVTKVVLQYRTDLAELMNAFVSMHRRLAMQQKEFSRQQDKVKSIKNSIGDLHNDSDERLNAMKLRQADLERRFAKISQELLKTHSPKISDAERKYFQELTRIDRLLHGARGIISRKTAAESQMRYIRESLALAKSEDNPSHDQSHAESPMQLTQLGRIKNQMASNDEILSQIKTRIERLNRLALSA